MYHRLVDFHNISLTEDQLQDIIHLQSKVMVKTRARAFESALREAEASVLDERERERVKSKIVVFLPI